MLLVTFTNRIPSGIGLNVSVLYSRPCSLMEPFKTQEIKTTGDMSAESKNIFASRSLFLVPPPPHTAATCAPNIQVSMLNVSAEPSDNQN